MEIVHSEPSRTFGEYLLIPRLSTKQCIPENVSLRTPVARFKGGTSSPLMLNVPIVAAAMQAVSGDALAIALARVGGLAFTYCSQSIEAQAMMVARVKRYKAGFVVSDSNLQPGATLADVIATTKRSGHSTVAITHDGSSTGKLLGIITRRDYRLGTHALTTPVVELMTPFSQLVYGKEGVTLDEANSLIWQHKLNCLPVVNAHGCLVHLVFRRDYEDHKANPNEAVDAEKRLLVGAAINSRDYKKRVPALLDAGADVLCVDSSDGFSEWQRETIEWVKANFGSGVCIGAGNVVDAEAFRYLADAGADFVKVGIGGGSICITREQKGIGRGQATSVIDVARARNAYLESTGIYVPICSDGGISQEYHITLALAMGADFVMMGRYFARFDEAPGGKVRVKNSVMKEYWGEGARRARNWERYDLGGEKTGLLFEEGIDSYVPYAGKLSDNMAVTLAKLRSTMCNCGSLSISELHSKARLTLVSATSIIEGGAHDVVPKDNEGPRTET